MELILLEWTETPKQPLEQLVSSWNVRGASEGQEFGTYMQDESSDSYTIYPPAGTFLFASEPPP